MTMMNTLPAPGFSWKLDPNNDTNDVFQLSLAGTQWFQLWQEDQTDDQTWYFRESGSTETLKLRGGEPMSLVEAQVDLQDAVVSQLTSAAFLALNKLRRVTTAHQVHSALELLCSFRDNHC